jgi:DNA-binding transcriptional LysR family regulator
MNFASMEYFEVLARERNFTRAAEHLHITQQSLSSHIAKLEKELGCQLIIRHVPLELTYAGEVFLAYATSMREQYTTMRQEFWDISQNDEGILRVGIAFTRGRTILPDIIMAFHRVHPHIRVQLVEDTNEALRQKLLEGDIDLAIAFFPSSLPGIRMRSFYREEVVIIALREMFESLYGDEVEDRIRRLEEGDYSALEGCPLVLGSIEDIGGSIEEKLVRRAGISRPRIVATSNNSETLLALCLRGAGATLCSETLARASLTEEQLESLLIIHRGSVAQYPIRFGYQEKHYQWSIIDSFMDIATQVMSQRKY